MKEENNIDKLFREGLQGRTAAGSPDSSWTEASAMLDQHFAKGAWFTWTKAAALLLLLGAATLGIWLYPSSHEVLEENSIQEADQSIVDTKELPKDAPAASDRRAVEEGQATLEAEGSLELLTPSSAGPNKAMTDTDAASANADASIATNKSSDNGSTPSSNAPSFSDVPSPTATAAMNASDPTEGIESLVDSPEAGTNASSTAGSLTYPSLNQSIAIEMEDMLSMPPFEVGSFNLRAAGIMDRDPLKKEALMTHLRKVEVLVEGGVLGASGFQNTGSTSTPIGFGWMGGLAVQYHFHNKLFARSGALLHTRDALNSNVLEAQRFEGSLEAVAQRISYVDIPLEVGYRSNRHSIHFGLLFSPLIATRTALTFTPNNADTETASIVEAYESRRTGFASFDVAGSAGYRFQLSQRLNAFATIRFGLFDITDNAYFGTALVDDRNHQLRLGLSYRILHL